MMMHSRVCSRAAIGNAVSLGAQLVGGKRIVRNYYPLTVLEGHENAVYRLLDIGNGLVVSGSLDTTLRVWDLNQGVCVRRLAANKDGAAHVGGIVSLILLSNGMIASGGRDKTIRVWDLHREEHQECVATLEDHAGAVTCIVELQDGRLVSGSEDHTVRIWSQSPSAKTTNSNIRRGGDSDGWTSRLLSNHTPFNQKAIDGHTRAISEMCELADGNVATASWDGTVRLWKVDATTDWVETCKPLPGRTVCELRKAPFGIMCTSYDSQNKVWRYDMNTSEEEPNPTKGKCLALHQNEPWGVRQLRDGRILVNSKSSEFSLWNLVNAEVVGWFKGHDTGPVCDVIELPNRMLVSAGWDGKVILWGRPAL